MASHAQKFFLRDTSVAARDRKRASIHDIRSACPPETSLAERAHMRAKLLSENTPSMFRTPPGRAPSPSVSSRGRPPRPPSSGGSPGDAAAPPRLHLSTAGSAFDEAAALAPLLPARPRHSEDSNVDGLLRAASDTTFGREHPRRHAGGLDKTNSHCAAALQFAVPEPDLLPWRAASPDSAHWHGMQRMPARSESPWRPPPYPATPPGSGSHISAFAAGVPGARPEGGAAELASVLSDAPASSATFQPMPPDPAPFEPMPGAAAGERLSGAATPPLPESHGAVVGDIAAELNLAFRGSQSHPGEAMLTASDPLMHRSVSLQDVTGLGARQSPLSAPPVSSVCFFSAPAPDGALV